MEGEQGGELDQGDRSLSFPPYFPAAVLDFGTLALREAPGFPDLLILLSLPFPSEVQHFREATLPEPGGCAHSACGLNCIPIVGWSDGVWCSVGVLLD